jgi:hypothetical protein
MKTGRPWHFNISIVSIINTFCNTRPPLQHRLTSWGARVVDNGVRYVCRGRHPSIHPYIHTYIHTYIHAHTHTYTHTKRSTQLEIEPRGWLGSGASLLPPPLYMYSQRPAKARTRRNQRALINTTTNERLIHATSEHLRLISQAPFTFGTLDHNP